MTEGIPLRDPDGQALLTGLEAACRSGDPDSAVRETCRRLGVVPREQRAGWRLYFSAPSGSRVLEIGPGFGEDTRDLVADGLRVDALAASPAQASLLRSALAWKGVKGVNVAAVSSLETLPYPDGTFQAVVIDHLAQSGFALDARSFPVVAKEWLRVLEPGGRIFIGAPNRVDAMVKLVKGRLHTGGPGPGVNRAVKTAGVSHRVRGPSPFRVMRVMHSLGWPAPRVYAPFPGEAKVQVVVPIEDRRTLRYFLDHMIRKNSALMRLAVTGARVLVNVGLFQRLVPFYYLVYTNAPARREGP